jgi:hypothetical protein
MDLNEFFLKIIDFYEIDVLLIGCKIVVFFMGIKIVYYRMF